MGREGKHWVRPEGKMSERAERRHQAQTVPHHCVGWLLGHGHPGQSCMSRGVPSPQSGVGQRCCPEPGDARASLG